MSQTGEKPCFNHEINPVFIAYQLKYAIKCILGYFGVGWEQILTQTDIIFLSEALTLVIKLYENLIAFQKKTTFN